METDEQMSAAPGAGTPSAEATTSRLVVITVVPAAAASATGRVDSPPPSGAVRVATAGVIPSPVTHVEWIVTVAVTDAAGHPLSGEPVDLEGPKGAVIERATGATSVSGEFASTVWAPRHDVSEVVLTASSGTLSTCAALALPPASVAVSALTKTVPVDGWLTVTATVLSAFETPVGDAEVLFSGEGAEFTLATGKTDPSGQYSTTVMPRRDAGSSMTVTATVAGGVVRASTTVGVTRPSA